MDRRSPSRCHDPGALFAARPGRSASASSPTATRRAAGGPPPVTGVDFHIAVRSRYFLCVTAAYVLVMAAQVGGISHLVKLASERSRQADRGPRDVGHGRRIGRRPAVRRVDRDPGADDGLHRRPRRDARAGAPVAGAGSTAAPGCSLLAAFFGITIGNLLMLQPLLIAEAFGVRDYARIYSRSQFVSTLGVAFGPLLLGVVHDAVDGYVLPVHAAGDACRSAAPWSCSPVARPRPPAERAEAQLRADRVGGRDVARDLHEVERRRPGRGSRDLRERPAAVARQGDAEQVAVDEEVGLQQDAQPAAAHELGPVAVARTQGVGSSRRRSTGSVGSTRARRAASTPPGSSTSSASSTKRNAVTIGRDVELVQPRSDDVVQRGVDRRRRSWGDRAQPGTGTGAPDLARQDAERVGPARSGRPGDEDVVARSHRQADRAEVGIADAHEDDVVVWRHDEQVVHRDVVGQRPDAGCGLTWPRPPG